MQFSSETLEVLQQAGWNPTRCVNISKYISQLEEEGYEVYPKAQEFLKQFGGLKLIYKHHRLPNSVDDAIFDPVLAAGGIFRTTIEGYEERIGEEAVVIGEACLGHIVLVMGRSGKVYGGYDDFLAFVGNSGQEAIENFCTGIKKIEIP